MNKEGQKYSSTMASQGTHTGQGSSWILGQLPLTHLKSVKYVKSILLESYLGHKKLEISRSIGNFYIV